MSKEGATEGFEGHGGPSLVSVTLGPTLSSKNCKISSDIVDLEQLHSIKLWIPGASQVKK